MDDLPIGRYGTIHYMSNNGSEVPLASYPVDEAVINLGRSDHNTCHIRLFDRWCSDIHCKLIFEEGKAFLVVLGQNGVVIDGSTFMPSENDMSPTTVPLTNGSEWLIFKRRFIFQYPPKDQRVKLMATPARKSRKSLRMSMINAAQLWTPSAPKTQEESWRRLKSPMQPFPGEEGGEITVVEGDPVHLSHNQEEVIVVESVDSPPEPDVAPPASARKPPQTPSKRGPANLHKQVLLMNSHRKHTRSIDELEEREVEESILVEDNSDEELEEDAASNPFIGKTPRSEKVVTVKKEEPEAGLDGSSFTAKSFRASLGAIGSILPFGRPSGVVHSPNPPPAEKERLNDQEMGQGEGLERAGALEDTRRLGPFFTPQTLREYKSHPRQSMGSAGYMDLDNDIEQARRRLASLATAERPQMVDVSEEQPTISQPVARSIKKSRASLPAVPELSSPLPTSKGRFSMAPMATIHEPLSLATPKKIDEEGEEDDTSDRLQQLMRTVEKETRREAIRESRRSAANPAAFYAAADTTSLTKQLTSPETLRHRPPGIATSNDSQGPAFPNIFKRSANHSSSQAEAEDESDTSAKDSEIPVNAKPKRGKAPSKQSTQVIGKRTAHVVETLEDQMQVDDPAVTSEDAQMEDVEDRPAKKARTTRKAKTPEVAPAARARRTKKAATIEDENADEESASVEENTSVSVTASRPRRGLRAESTSPAVEPQPSTSTRRVGRPKATPVTPAVESMEEDPAEGSSASGVEPASRGKGRRGKPVAAPKIIKKEAGESIQEDGNDEMDAPAPKKAPARRATRGKATQQAEADSEQASEEASPVPAKAVPKKAPARGKAKAAPAGGEGSMEADSEPVAQSKAKPSGRSSRKVAVKDEEADDAEAALEAKPRRTTRTKR